MRFKQDGIPVLKGIIDGSRLTVWCPVCSHSHFHGKDQGHRVAHCASKDSPYHLTGYYIATFSKKELKDIAEAARAGVRGEG